MFFLDKIICFYNFWRYGLCLKDVVPSKKSHQLVFWVALARLAYVHKSQFPFYVPFLINFSRDRKNIEAE
jgi:hypothetical protein